jgi:hypothetical protein
MTKTRRIALSLFLGSLLPLAGVTVLGTLQGCTTTQQTATYKTLYTLEASTTTAYIAYVQTVIAGTTSTNSLPTVSKAFNDFQAAMVLAAALNQNNTNALAPTSLQTEAIDLVNLIAAVKGK